MSTPDPPPRPWQQRALTRRELLALLGVGAAGTAFVGSPGWVSASVPPDEPAGPELPLGTVEPQLFAAPPAETIADVAAGLNWDVEAMFRYVRDETDYHAYNGVLGGANGTLWGKSGNSVDRALLLAALLDEAQVPWRFATGSLDATAADKLLHRPSRTVADAKGRFAKVVLPPDVSDTWSGQGAWSRQPEADELFALTAQRVDATVELLTSALTAAGIEPVTAAATLPAEEQARHVWIQYADGADWIDLDPSLPDAAIGDTLTTPTETSAELPEDLYHVVTFRLVAEVVTAGTPTRTEVLRHGVRAADLVGVPIYVVHPPASWLGVAGAITGDQQYRPALLAGDAVVRSSVLILLDKGEGALEALGTEDTAEGQTLAEWLEVDVDVPGVGTRTETRLLFDRIPPERRETGDLALDDLPPIELTHIDDELGDVYLPCANPLVLSVTGHAIPWDAVRPPSVVPPDTGDVARRSSLAYPYLHDLIALEHVDRAGGLIRSDEPLITMIRVDRQVGVDLLHCHRVVVPMADAPAGAAGFAWSGVTAGAVSHASERALLHGAAGLSDEPVDDLSAGRIFELAADNGIDVVTLTPGDPIRIEGLAPSVRQLIDDALSAGRVVVLPARTVNVGGRERLGWWEYDPISGFALDRLDTGGRAGLTEENALIYLLLFGCGIFALGVIGAVVITAAGVTDPYLNGIAGVAMVGGGFLCD